MVMGDHVWAVTWDERDIPRLVRYRIAYPSLDPSIHIRSIGDFGPPHGLVLKSVEVNVPLPDSLFLPPEERG